MGLKMVGFNISTCTENLQLIYEFKANNNVVICSDIALPKRAT